MPALASLTPSPLHYPLFWCRQPGVHKLVQVKERKGHNQTIILRTYSYQPISPTIDQYHSGPPFGTGKLHHQWQVRKHRCRRRLYWAEYQRSKEEKRREEKKKKRRNRNNETSKLTSSSQSPLRTNLPSDHPIPHLKLVPFRIRVCKAVSRHRQLSEFGRVISVKVIHHLVDPFLTTHNREWLPLLASILAVDSRCM